MSKVTLLGAEYTNSAGLLSVEAGTNCPQVIDQPNEGRTILRLVAPEGIPWVLMLDKGPPLNPSEINLLVFGNDAGLIFIEALEFALTTLKAAHRVQKDVRTWEEEVP